MYQGMDRDKAIKARLNCELYYYKDFAPQKHLFEQYGITQETANYFVDSRIKNGIASNNTSGVTGVSYNKWNKKWLAYIYIDKHRIALGSFADKEEAIQARLAAERIYLHEDKRQKLPIEQGEQNNE